MKNLIVVWCVCLPVKKMCYSFLWLPPCIVGPHSRMRDWKRTVSIEIEKFLGLLLMMGILKKPLIAQYWSKNPLYSMPLFGSVMSQNYCCRCYASTTTPSNEQASRDDPLRDKLFKLIQVVDHLFEHFQRVYSMSQNVCIDKSLLVLDVANFEERTSSLLTARLRLWVALGPNILWGPITHIHRCTYDLKSGWTEWGAEGAENRDAAGVEGVGKWEGFSPPQPTRGSGGVS